MSMFHELMMRKKEQIMYATIKGTLTENDGVFSGFSASNYLLTQDYISIDNTSNIEIVTKINISNYQDVNALLSTNTRYGFYLRINYTNHILCYLGNGSSFNIANGVAGSNTLDNNKTYYIKIKISNGSFSIMISEDNQTYITDNTFDISSLTTTQQYRINFGVGRNTSNYFKGSIDLNRSYIKLGSTKYKLQAVVGYTVVGSPTITDGVMTRANASDTSYIYFKLNEIKNSIKVNMKFKVTTLNVDSCLFDPAGYSLSFRVSNANKIVCRIFPLFNSSKNYTVTGTTTIQANTWYWIRVDLNKERVIVYLSLDGITYTQDGSLEFETQMNFPHNFNGESVKIGYASTVNLIIGSIDLNNTDVNIDNKLYFNGQQA